MCWVCYTCLYKHLGCGGAHPLPAIHLHVGLRRHKEYDLFLVKKAKVINRVHYLANVSKPVNHFRRITNMPERYRTRFHYSVS